MIRRKLIGRIIILGSIAVLLVPAIWERYQSEVAVSSLTVPEPPTPYRELSRELVPAIAPDTDDFFVEFYSIDDEKLVESSRPSMDEIATKTPRAWVLKVREYQNAALASQVNQQLRNADFPSYVTPNANAQGPYTVLVGPYLNFERAQEYQLQLQSDYDITTTLLKFKP